jgi:hypothetical protein
MSGTVWTTKVKEGLTEKKKRSNPTTRPPVKGNGNARPSSISASDVANFGNDIYIGKDADELILTGDTKVTFKASKDESKEKTEPAFIDELNDIYKNADINKASRLYVGGIATARQKFDGVKDNIAGFIASWFYDTFESPEAKNDLEILSSQISTWFAVIPMSYLMVINWWYILAYSNYVIDFRDYILNLPILKWSMTPTLYAFELLNYYTITFRMDVNSTFPPIETSRKWFWDYRPIWFSIFHLFTFGPMLMFPVVDMMESTMMNTGLIFAVVSVMSIYYFFSLLVRDRWYSDPLFYGMSGLFLLIAGLILSFLMMFAFVGLLCPLFLLYTLFLSYMVIFAFNGFWPPSVISVYNQIFQELKEAPVYEKMDKWGKLKNAAFQNFHSIYLLIIMGGFFLANAHQAMSFSNESLIVIAILANLIICVTFAPSAFTVPFDLLKIFMDDGKEGELKQNVPEAPIRL